MSNSRKMTGDRGVIYSRAAFSRADEGDDAEFYATRAFGQHLDSRALATVERVVGTLVTEPSPAILDLMAGADSHLPERLTPGRMVGLGLNKKEMAANPRLSEHVLHDLNRLTRLPFADETFDAVLNTVSLAYLTDPFAVFREVARVLKRGGLFLVIYSHRMFRDKTTKVWLEASEMERQIIVEDFFADSGAFFAPQSFISMGLPRPADDKYAGLGIPSDPIWAVYAERRGKSRSRAPRPEVPPETIEGPSREEVKRREERVKDTLECPHCQTKLTQWEIPDSPFNEWPNDYMYICFNNQCPYLLQGWSVMTNQGSPGFSYRLMYNPALDRCMPTPVPSLRACQENVVTPRG